MNSAVFGLLRCCAAPLGLVGTGAMLYLFHTALEMWVLYTLIAGGVGLLVLASWWHLIGKLLARRPALSRLARRVRLGHPCAVVVLGLTVWGSAAQAGEVWVVNTGSHDVSVIETITHRVVATIPVGQQPRYLRFTPDGREAWVTNLASRDISIIDAEAKRVVTTLAPGGSPHDVAFSVDGRTAVITDHAATYG